MTLKQSTLKKNDIGKKLALLMVSAMAVLNLCGCFALFAGGVVAGGAGAAVWLSGKLSQEFHASYQSTIDATKSALQSLNLAVTKQTREEDLTQIKSVYPDGREVWIDIHRLGENTTRVEVRVGVNDKDTDTAILRKIESFLPGP